MSLMLMHIASLMKIPCYLLKLSSGNKNMGLSRAYNFVKLWRNFPISIPKQDLLNVNAYSKFGENPLLFTQVIVWKRKYGHVSGDNSVRNWRNLSISNPKPDLHNINTHTKLVKIHWCLHNLSSGKEKWTDERTYDRRTDGRTPGRPTWNHNPPPILWRGIKSIDIFCYFFSVFFVVVFFSFNPCPAEPGYILHLQTV